MSYASYRYIPIQIASNSEYTHGSSHAVNMFFTGPEVYKYQVYSYDTLIYQEYEGKCEVFDSDYYSRTTSRLQNIIRNVKKEQLFAMGLQPKGKELQPKGKEIVLKPYKYPQGGE